MPNPQPKVISSGVLNAVVWIGVAAYTGFLALLNLPAVSFLTDALIGLIVGHVLTALIGVRIWVRE